MLKRITALLLAVLFVLLPVMADVESLYAAVQANTPVLGQLTLGEAYQGVFTQTETVYSFFLEIDEETRVSIETENAVVNLDDGATLSPGFHRLEATGLPGPFSIIVTPISLATPTDLPETETNAEPVTATEDEDSEASDEDAPIAEHIATPTDLDDSSPLIEESNSTEDARVTVDVPGAPFAISVTYGPEANIPPEAIFVASQIDDMTYAAQALQVAGDSADLLGIFDLTILVDGVAYEPEGPVTVTVIPDEAPENGADVFAVHFTGAPALQRPMKAMQMGKSVSLLERDELSTAVTASETGIETLNANVDEEGRISFTTSSFSVFAILSLNERTDVAGLTGRVRTDAGLYRYHTLLLNEKITTVPKGATVKLLSSYGGLLGLSNWYRVQYGNVEGYIEQAYIDLIIETELPSVTTERFTAVLTGLLPEGTVLHAQDIVVDDKEEMIQEIQDILAWYEVTEIALFDLTLLDAEGVSFEPDGSIHVSLELATPIVLNENEDICVIHLRDEGTEIIRDVDTVTKDGDIVGVSFATDSFSTFGIATIRKLETRYITADGETYRISVTFDEDAGIPDDAELSVDELTGDEFGEYIAQTALALNTFGFKYARVFDISIVDNAGIKMQPMNTVQVAIELLDAEALSDGFSVLHFNEENEAPEQMDAETEGNIVSFNATGFSAYAIVEGPSEIPLGWTRLSSFDEINELGQEGVLLSSKGYFLTGEVAKNVTANPDRDGLMGTTKSYTNPEDAKEAVKYYFRAIDGNENQYIIYVIKDGTPYYVQMTSVDGNAARAGLTLVGNEGEGSIFTIERQGNNNCFYLSADVNGKTYYWNRNTKAQGNGAFAGYDNKGDGNTALLEFWYYLNPDSDPYGLNNQSFGLMNWNGGVAGKALMANSSSENRLNAKSLTVMSTANNSRHLFVPNDSDISMWTFNWLTGNKYHLSTVQDGSIKYLKLDAKGLSLVSDENEASEIQVIPGTGSHSGEICLKSGNNTLTYSGTVEGGFSVGGSAGNEWLNLVDLSELTKDYFLTYSAEQVSVSAESITNGSRVIVYTRSWNEKNLKYDYYAISSDGTLVPVYESGDSIEWVSGQINTLLWNFVEYYWEGTNDPNFYYELYNQYSEKFIAPQITGEQILSNDTIGINLNGRRDGQYYSSILAWDEDNYSYVGLKVEDGKIVTCPKSEAMDFYFAVMQDLNVDDELTTVQTVDHTQYGITMKIVNFGGKTGSHNGGSTSTEQQFEVIGDGSYTQNSPTTGLLSTYLGDNDYPTAVKTNKSLEDLFKDAKEVNHLFISSTYSGTGYFEFDSTENFATLTDNGDFRVYRELGTMDGDNKNTLKHGQFMPYNDLEAGVFASVNGKNLYSAEAKPLADSDPRKYEQMYLVRDPDYYYGVELEASFTQTPNGLDAWGHDIIYEFTGDDDFWLYVDGELVIDLGGIHGALPGSVNFRTGEVVVNGAKTTLKDLFYNNYLGRTQDEQEAQEYVEGIFQQNSAGQWVFKDDTTHTMRIFYMERGAGAANLHMRFNLAAVKKGTVQLTKELDGVDESDVLAEFPYQIFYRDKKGEEHPLTNELADNSEHNEDYVFYKDTVNPVKYQDHIEIDGIRYNDVFFLKPGETADISFPENMVSYRIVECGINSEVYKNVTVNGQSIEGKEVDKSNNRKDYEIDYKTTDERPKVKYVNTVNPEALRTLTITKELYEADGEKRITYSENDTEFTFRLQMASEFSKLDVANMQTYHVKDPDGNYCQWNTAEQKFETIGNGIQVFAELTEKQKVSASFTTSIYGTIARIPVDHIVEFRNVLAGTQFMVQERSGEIPDGYSFQRYVYNGNDSENTADVGIAGTVVAGQDSKVIVKNLKGWGLRVNKVWRDKDYMSSRDATYFALFTKDSEDTLNLVPGSVRKLSYETNPQSIYWYYDRLPVQGTKGLGDYLIREVKLSGTELSISSDGVVSGYEAVTPIENNGEITLNGTQKGEISSSEFTYQVQYAEGEISHYSNVRVDTVTNDRPGIILKKQDWDGKSLQGSVFTLETDETTVGTFTSDEDGMITTAFLSNDKNYILTETDAPQGYHGLETAMTIRVVDGKVTVSGPAGEYYTLTQAEGTTLATLIIKNRPYTFIAVKKDGDSDAELANVEFALHRQVTVHDVTTIDLDPMSGYERLVTDAKGIIPKIDSTLPAGTYELVEKKKLADYNALSGPIRFTISPTGDITLGSHPNGVTLTGVPDNDGTLEYVLTILNYKPKDFTFTKVWRDSGGNTNISWPEGKSITVNILQGKGEDGSNPTKYATYKISKTDDGSVNTEIIASEENTNLPKLKVIENSNNSYTFKLEDLPSTVQVEVYYVSETETVDGYQPAKYYKGDTQVTDASWIGDGGTIANDQQGYVLPSTGASGTSLIYLLGTILTAFAGALLMMRLRRRVN